LSVRTSVRRPGRGARRAHPVDRLDRQPLEQRHAGAQRGLEVELALHRLPGDLGDLRLAAGLGGQHLDDLALHERRVDVHHDEPAGAAPQGRRLDGDVDGLLHGLGRQLGAQATVSPPETSRSYAASG
jgi:hypothetical protein